MTVDIILGLLLSAGIVIVQAMVAWALHELYKLRQEVSGSHAEFRAKLSEHERRLHRLENYID